MQIIGIFNYLWAFFGPFLPMKNTQNCLEVGLNQVKNFKMVSSWPDPG